MTARNKAMTVVRKMYLNKRKLSNNTLGQKNIDLFPEDQPGEFFFQSTRPLL